MAFAIRCPCQYWQLGEIFLLARGIPLCIATVSVCAGLSTALAQLFVCICIIDIGLMIRWLEERGLHSRDATLDSFPVRRNGSTVRALPGIVSTVWFC